MSSLTNIAINARSMNGLITISDGQGTTIEDGTIDTDNLVVDNFTVINMLVNYMNILRDSNPVVNAALGSTVDIGLLVQNMIFDDINRLYQIWDDTATDKVFEVDVSNNTITFNNSTVSFPSSTVTIDRTSTVALKTLLGSTINVPNLLQNLNFDNINRYFEIWNDSATAALFKVSTNTGIIRIENGVNFIINNNPVSFQLSAVEFNACNVSFPSSLVTFNSNLPTSTLTPTTSTQLITKGYADTTFQPVGSYATLGGANAFTGNTNTFNSFLPTSTISTTTGGTQFITRAIGDGRFGQLAVANTWALQNTFSTGILPRRAAGDGTDIQLGGANQMQYRQATSQYNIGIGANTIVGDSVVGGRVNNTGKRNIGIGETALQTMDAGNDCIAIGYQAMQNCGSIRVYTVSSQRDIAIGTGAMKNGIYGTDNIGIGYQCLQNNTSGNNNIIFGSNVGNGINGEGNNVIIGAGALPTAKDNGICCIGYSVGSSAQGQMNRAVWIGEQAGKNNTGFPIGPAGSGIYNTYIGALSGNSNTTGSFHTCIGTNSGNGGITNATNCVSIGVNSAYTESYEFVIGGDDTTGADVSVPRLTLPNKTRLACNQNRTGATVTLTFRTNENVILTDSTTTTINLPTPSSTNSNNIGCKFNIIRAVTTTNDITINAPAGQTIGQNQYDGIISTSSSYLMRKGENQISVLCVGKTGMTWLVINTSLSYSSDTALISSTIPLPTINYGLTFGGLAGLNYYPQFSDPTNINYKPSTQTLTATNISSTSITATTVTGSLSGTATNATNVGVTDQTGSSSVYYLNFTSNVTGNLPINAGSNLNYNPSSKTLFISSGVLESYKSRSTCYQYLTQNTLITAATTLTDPLRSYYPFTMKTAAGYIVTVPEITALTVGTQLVFKRIGGSLQILTLATTNNQPIFLGGNAVGVVGNSTIVSASQSCCTLVATQIQDAGAGTYLNAPGSASISITQTSGTLAIGGIINLNGTIRYIVSYGTGLGGSGSYNVNATLPTSSGGLPYTSSVTYGWSVVSVS